MGRAPCCAKDGVKKGPWTPEEDQMLIDYIQQHGQGNWRTLPKKAGLARCGKSCRLRWTNYLRPDIKRGRFSFEEEETIIHLHSVLGNKWSAIAAHLPGRTDNEIKNYWNTHIRKRLLRMGIDPLTHAPRLDILDLSSILTSSILGNPAASEIDLLRSIACGLLSVQCQNSDMPFHQQAQQLASVSPELQRLPTSTNISSGSLILDEEQLMQLANVGQILPASQHMDPWPADFMMQYSSENNYSASVTSVNYENLNPSHSQQVAVHGSSNMYWPNSQLSSVLSTPAASASIHLSSSTTTSRSSEDERESGCSNLLFDFEIPRLLDISNYILPELPRTEEHFK